MSAPRDAAPGPPASWHEAARSLMGEPRLTGPEVAAAAGCSYEDARRLWQAMGLPPVPEGSRVFTESDVRIVRAVGSLGKQAGIAPDVVAQLSRVVGRSMANMADAFVSVVAERVGSFEAIGDLDRDGVLAAGVAAYGPAMDPVLLHVWRHELLAALLRVLSGAAAGGGQALAVGFADLVGFTALSQQLDTAELTALVDRFETLAYARIVERGGRVVKMIGDEVMFAADGATSAAEIALALVEACAAEPSLPPVRVGVALGPVLAWEGDLYGPTVNLASRLVAVARPGSVLVSDDLGSRLDDGALALRRLRPLRLRGIGAVRFWVVRRGPGRRGSVLVP